jgi:hypothetical protein
VKCENSYNPLTVIEMELGMGFARSGAGKNLADFLATGSGMSV